MRINLYFTIMFALFALPYGYSQTDTNVIYFDLDPDVYIWHTTYLQSHTDSFKIDLNEDDTLDIKFYFMNSKYSMHYIASLNTKCVYAFFNSSDSDSLSSSNLNWWTYPFQWLIPMVDSVRLGVKFINGSDVYYGWIKALAMNEGPYIKSYTIDKYAFCKIPNYPFMWGQTEIFTQIPDVQFDHPEIVTVCQTGNILLVNSKELIKTITLLNIAGMEVYSKSGLNENAIQINTGNYTHGAYIIKIGHKDGSMTTKKIVF